MLTLRWLLPLFGLWAAQACSQTLEIDGHSDEHRPVLEANLEDRGLRHDGNRYLLSLVLTNTAKIDFCISNYLNFAFYINLFDKTGRYELEFDGPGIILDPPATPEFGVTRVKASESVSFHKEIMLEDEGGFYREDGQPVREYERGERLIYQANALIFPCSFESLNAALVAEKSTKISTQRAPLRLH